MIRLFEIAEAGVFNKPHGINGEISATLDIDVDLNTVRCIVVSVDGIFVPFFLSSVRPKTAETVLLTIDGIDSEAKTQQFINKPFYLLRSDIPEEEDAYGDEDGMYASDFIGYTVIDRHLGELGDITGINDSTQNILFIIETPDNKELLLPVADEFIESFDIDKKVLRTDLPDGLADINS